LQLGVVKLLERLEEGTWELSDVSPQIQEMWGVLE
jgi:hypothetical protein